MQHVVKEVLFDFGSAGAELSALSRTFELHPVTLAGEAGGPTRA